VGLRRGVYSYDPFGTRGVGAKVTKKTKRERPRGLAVRVSPLPTECTMHQLAIKRIADDNFVFQQHSAPVHLVFNTAVTAKSCQPPFS